MVVVVMVIVANVRVAVAVAVVTIVPFHQIMVHPMITRSPSPCCQAPWWGHFELE